MLTFGSVVLLLCCFDHLRLVWDVRGLLYMCYPVCSWGRSAVSFENRLSVGAQFTYPRQNGCPHAYQMHVHMSLSAVVCDKR